MRQVNKEKQAVSVIIGALMLVVITVGAAVVFAAFISEQQAEYQENERIKQQTDLERILTREIKFDVSDLVDGLIIQNTGINSIDIWSITINDFIVVSCDVDGTSVTLDGTDVITVDSLDSIIVTNIGSTVDKSGPITINVWTKLKAHEHIFYQPVAIIQLDMSATPQICDGTQSYSITDNAYILKWEWIITDNGVPSGSIYAPKITAGFSSGHTYDISLEVTDNYGMISSDTYSFTQP